MNRPSTPSKKDQKQVTTKTTNNVQKGLKENTKFKNLNSKRILDLIKLNNLKDRLKQGMMSL